ncbi:MAG: alpha/beta hydrolase fold domain-containing protein [Phycisphaerae bacterium]|nr:alpha/beta hydrolase fold domain-containing protein [Phycisphaerae bacterium]
MPFAPRPAAWILLLSLAPIASVIAETPPTPPAQPQRGPGGATYPHQSLRSWSQGEGADLCWVFEPDQPRPADAPVIVFLHGWAATNPSIYGGWIKHLVRRGNLVIYPRYQANARDRPDRVTPRALSAVGRALRRLRSGGGGVAPRESQFAITGHSVGGILTANLAALAADNGLPVPRAIMSIQPGISRRAGFWRGVPLENLARIPGECLVLVVVGDRDRVTGEADGRRIFRQSSAVPNSNKAYVRLVTDTHGSPPLLAGHMAPVAWSELGPMQSLKQSQGPVGRSFGSQLTLAYQQHSTDAMDYYGLWRRFDALCAAAFDRRHRDLALGPGPVQANMGKWSDGTPVTPAMVVDQP